MKKSIFLSIALGMACAATAQEQSQNATDEKQQEVRYKLMIRPLELIVPNISLTAERVFDKRSLGVTLAFKPATRDNGRITAATGLFGNYRSVNMLNEAYNAFSAGINSKTYFHPHKRKTTYIDGVLLYRYWWFDNKNVSYPNVEGYRFEGNRSERANVYNAKVLFGYSAVGRKNKRTKVIADFYGGLDIRYKTWEYTTFNGTVMNEYHSYYNEKGSYWTGSPYIGMQLGIGR